MTILVTGATGCVGRNLCEHLHRQGYKVTATGRNTEVGDELKKLGVKFIPADICDQEMMNQLCYKRVVYHCAAKSSPWGDYEDFYKANVLGVKTMINACREGKAERMIYISSPSIYFEFKDEFDIREDKVLPKQSANHYIETKKMAEALIDTAYREHQLPVITIRPRAIYGKYDQTIIPRIIDIAKKGRVPLINRGEAMIDVTNVDNLVSVLENCLQVSDACYGKKYNISNGSPIRLKELIDSLLDGLEMQFKYINIPYPVAYSVAVFQSWISKITAKEPRFTPYSVGVLAKGQTLNIEAATSDLNYQVKYSIQDGIEKTIEWYKNAKS